MTYKEAIEYLFVQIPAFERSGASGYKPGLERVMQLYALFGSPEKELRASIHVAGTNGKGSTSHTLAAILQSQGYRVGLFTSPHLIDFRERIRVDGKMITEDYVTRFVEKYLSFNADFEPSFFELTTVMALRYFADQDVDVAVIEVGLGGRLDSTNIISPDLCVITNIALDHTDLLGLTRREIAGEKAGIIKSGVDVVVGESDDEIRDVFVDRCRQCGSSLCFAEEPSPILESKNENGRIKYQSLSHGEILGALAGDCQIRNTATILKAVDCLNRMGWGISDEAVRIGFLNVVEMTGLSGRWQILNHDPLTVCDTAHNPAGWRLMIDQIGRLTGFVHLVIGFVADKDVADILRIIEPHSRRIKFYFVSPDSHRALAAEVLGQMAVEVGIKSPMEVAESVAEGYKKALADCSKGDSIFVGGSNYVVAELLDFLRLRR